MTKKLIIKIKIELEDWRAELDSSTLEELRDKLENSIKSLDGYVVDYNCIENN